MTSNMKATSNSALPVSSKGVRIRGLFIIRGAFIGCLTFLAFYHFEQPFPYVDIDNATDMEPAVAASCDHLHTSLSSASSSSVVAGPRMKLHVIVAHCDASIRWTWESFIHPFKFDTMTVITKCGKPPTVREFPDRASDEGQIIQIVELPNFGRCEHSYAYWIEQMVEHHRRQEDGILETNASSATINFTDYDFDFKNDLVLFMKDTDNALQRRNWEYQKSFASMRSIVLQHHVGSGSAGGFACGSQLLTWGNVLDPSMEKVTNMAERVELGRFKIDTYSGARNETTNTSDFLSPHRPMWRWLDYLNTTPRLDQNPQESSYNTNATASLSSVDVSALNFSMSPHVTDKQDRIIPVCFGGRFLVSIDRIVHNHYVKEWEPFVQSLSRGNNIEEGHYMERLWAALLAKKLPLHIQRGFISRKVRHFTSASVPEFLASFTGLLTISVDGGAPLVVGRNDDDVIHEYCFNCRLKTAMSSNMTNSSSSQSPILEKCYRVMELRGCDHHDENEIEWRIKKRRAINDATPSSRGGKAMLRPDRLDLYQL